MKRMFVAWFGVGAYVRWVQPLSALYHSLFRTGDMREQGLGLACELIADGDVVFDVGAHIGKFTAIAAQRVGQTGRVVSFEPVGWSRAVLARMVRLRGLRQVQIVAAGVSDHSGTGVMRVPLRADGRPEFMLSYVSGAQAKGEAANDVANEEHVALITLDEYCDQHELKQVDFIKCDTEGHESEVFRGAVRLLERARPTIYCEISAKYEARAGSKPDDLFSVLGARGYLAFLTDRDGRSLVRVEGYQRDTDYLFIHADRLPLVTRRISPLRVVAKGAAPSYA